MGGTIGKSEVATCCSSFLGTNFEASGDANGCDHFRSVETQKAFLECVRANTGNSTECSARAMANCGKDLVIRYKLSDDDEKWLM